MFFYMVCYTNYCYFCCAVCITYYLAVLSMCFLSLTFCLILSSKILNSLVCESVLWSFSNESQDCLIYRIILLFLVWSKTSLICWFRICSCSYVHLLHTFRVTVTVLSHRNYLVKHINHWNNMNFCFLDTWISFKRNCTISLIFTVVFFCNFYNPVFV